MIVYLSLFGISTFLSYFIKKKYIYIPIAILLILFSAIRSPKIGTDSKTYLEILNNPEAGINLKEKLYYYFNYMSNYFNFNSFFLFGLISSVIIIIVMYFIVSKVDPKFRWVALYLYLFNPYLYIQSNFNILRQGLAMSISLIFLNFFLKKKYVLAILFFIIAFEFHASVFIVVLVPVFSLKLVWNKKRILLLLIFMYLLKVFGGFKYIVIKLAESLNLFYNQYLNYTENIFANNLVVTLHFIWFIVLILQYKKMYKNRIEKKIVDVFFVVNALYFFFCLNSIFLRIYVYFYLWSIYFVALIIKNTKSKIILLSYLTYTTLLFLLFYYLNSSNTYYFPYRTLMN